MRLYWYWPFGRFEDSRFSAAVLGPDDSLVIDTLRREGGPVSLDDRIEVRASLPEVSGNAEGTPRWAISRTTTYVRRALVRQRTVRGGDFDLVHVLFLNRFTDPIALRFLRRRGPIVATVHDARPHENRLPGAGEAKLLAALYSVPDLLIAHHPNVATALVEEFGVSGDRVRTIPLPVPAATDTPVAAGDLRTEVLLFGTLRRNKGVPEFLEAVSRLRDPNLIVRVAGRGAAELERAVLDAAAQDPRIRPEIGWVTPERKAELYRRARVVVLPYTSFDSQSAVLLDAYAHGTPVVVSDLGSLGADVRGDATGWVVPPGDPEAITRAVTEALSSDDRWGAASTATRQAAAMRQPERVGGLVRDAYRELLSRPAE